MNFVKEERKFDAIPDDIYTAEVVDVNPVPGEKVDPETGEVRKWTAVRFKFKIIDTDPAVFNKTVFGQVYASGKKPDGELIVDPGTPLDKWFGVLGINFNVGDKTSDGALIGKRCTVVITNSKSTKKGKEVNYSNVTDIKHIKGSVGASSPVPAPAPVVPPVQAQAQAPTQAPAPVAATSGVKAGRKAGRKINF